MYDLYGAEDRSVQELGRAIGAALGVRFALHDSDYMGESIFCISVQVEKSS